MNETPQPPEHGPTCIGFDAGCPDCKAIHDWTRAHPADPAQPPQPIERDTLERWRAEVEVYPTAERMRALLDEVDRLTNELEHTESALSEATRALSEAASKVAPESTTPARAIRMLRERHASLLDRVVLLESRDTDVRTGLRMLSRRLERIEAERELPAPSGPLSVVDRGISIERAALEHASQPRATRADLDRWKAQASDVPGPLGRTLHILLAEVDRFEALLRRVRCYAIVDPLGNPALLGVQRMGGIERDIDDALDR